MNCQNDGHSYSNLPLCFLLSRVLVEIDQEAGEKRALNQSKIMLTDKSIMNLGKFKFICFKPI